MFGCYTYVISAASPRDQWVTFSNHLTVRCNIRYLIWKEFHGILSFPILSEELISESLLAPYILLYVCFTNLCFTIKIFVIPHELPALFITYPIMISNFFSMFIVTSFDENASWNFLPSSMELSPELHGTFRTPFEQHIWFREIPWDLSNITSSSMEFHGTFSIMPVSSICMKCDAFAS